MSQDLSPSHWNHRYSEGRTGWDRGASNPQLMRWLEKREIAAKSSVLIPGCGRGHEVIELAKRGFEVTAIDFADHPLASLKAELAGKNLTATVLQADVFTCNLSNDFDYIYEQTCLCAIDPILRVDYEKCLRKWLKPKGKLLALFMQTNRTTRPPFHCSLDSMKDLFSENHWFWQKQVLEKVPHPAKTFELAAVLTKKA